MRATLLTAQRMADSIVRDAEAKRDEILAKADTDAKEKTVQYQQELIVAQERLAQGQQELAKFISASRDLCARELKFLEQLPQLEVEQPAPAREEARVEEIGENVLAAFAAQQAEDAEEEQEEAPVEEAPVAETPAAESAE